MPFNSFDDYYMSWRPQRSRLTRPYYLCLANLLEEEISSGRLAANTKLPPQRELADFLDLNLSTVTKAYKLCETRGLVHATVGSGTFVTPHAITRTAVEESSRLPGIDMGSVHPFYEHNTRVVDVARAVVEMPGAEGLFEYSNPLGSSGQVAAGVDWMRSLGVDASAEGTLIAPGVQGALNLVLTSLFNRGDRVAVDAYTYPNLIGLAKLLGIQLVSVPGDKEGMLPERLDKLCSVQDVKGLYIVPARNNPTNVQLSPGRRKDIASIVAARGLVAIEDDNGAAILKDAPTPLCASAPDDCIYLSGLSKAVCSGLRIAYLSAPPRMRDRLRQGALFGYLKVPGLNAEIAAELVRSGAARDMAQEKRALAESRNEVLARMFPETSVVSDSFYQWIRLPEGMSGALCEAEVAKRGGHVLGAERFSVGRDAPANYVRVATSSPRTDEDLTEGLRILRSVVESQQTSGYSIIV